MNTTRITHKHGSHKTLWIGLAGALVVIVGSLLFGYAQGQQNGLALLYQTGFQRQGSGEKGFLFWNGAHRGPRTDKRFASWSSLCRWPSPNRRPLLHQFSCDSFHSSGETERGRLQRIPVALPVRRRRRAVTTGSIDPAPRAKALAAVALL